MFLAARQWPRNEDKEVLKPGAEWFEALVRHSSDLIVVVDAQAVVRYVNPAALAMLARFEDEVLGSDAFGYVHPGDHEHTLANLAKLLASPDTPVTDTMRVVSATGEIRVLETVTTNCLNEAGVEGLVINGRDVTERNAYITRLQASFDAVAHAFANAVELRDPYTAGHQRQTAELATAIARELNLDDDEVKGITAAAALHDIGKIAVPPEFLTRPGHLSPAESEIIKSHAQAGHDIITDVPFPWPVADMVLQHHERMDGSGYPQGLHRDEILPGTRILAVADVISAMCAHRPYRPALEVDAALAEIEVNREKLYDPDAVDACLRLFHQRAFKLTPSI